MSNKTLKRRRLVGEPQGWPEDVPAVMQRVYAARGVLRPEDVERRLASLHSPSQLGSVKLAAQILAEAILNDRKIMVAGDYDCDGATGSAVAVRGLRMLGAKHVDFIVPNRFVHGYGLSPALVAAMQPTPDVIVTVDSGVSSVEGVAAAKARGITVVITDHHLPGETLPAADAIVNPNLKGDPFPSKMLAGVGVMFYTLLVLRSHMRALGEFSDKPEPDLAELLDLVAVGTVADLVPLDRNNRILVDAGLRRIRSGKTSEGIKALIASTKCDPNFLAASDIAFSIAPKLNAAGRLEDMELGVRTLISDNPEFSMRAVARLDAINSTRKEMQAEMVTKAEEMVATTVTNDIGVVVFDSKWHAGIVGLVASKLKENLHRPVIAFAPAGEGSLEVRGSGRSISGFHLRDALALIDAQHPGLIIKFGGHAMAAGLSMFAKDIPEFSKAFNKIAHETLDAEQLDAVIYTDGELDHGYINLDFARFVRSCGPWGQGFAEPVFENVFEVEEWAVMAEKHLRFNLIDPRDGTHLKGVFFFAYDGSNPPLKLRAAYELSINVWNERERLQLMIRHIEPA